jgi:hypothetical protein
MRLSSIKTVDVLVDAMFRLQRLQREMTRLSRHDEDYVEKPAPKVEILTFWQVYFDANRVIRDTFAGAGFPVPEQYYALRAGQEIRLAKTA